MQKLLYDPLSQETHANITQNWKESSAFLAYSNNS